jgi:hypothetical protein
MGIRSTGDAPYTRFVAIGWWKRRRKREDVQAVERAEERRHQTPAERRVSSGDFTALKSNERAARLVLEPNIDDAKRLAGGDESSDFADDD